MNKIILIVLVLVVIGVIFLFSGKKGKVYKHKYRFSKGFQHNELGKPNPEELDKFYNALERNNQSVLYEMKLNGKLVDPMSALTEPSVIKIKYEMPDFPEYNTKEQGKDMLTVYAMALARDVPFSQYDNSPYLDSIREKLDPKIKKENLFRFFNKNNFGPYISQLLLHNVIYTNENREQKYLIHPPINTLKQRLDYGIDLKEMVDIQNIKFKTEEEPRVPLYLFCGRSLADFVESDVPFQNYINAHLILRHYNCPREKSIPVLPLQEFNNTFSGDISMWSLIGEVCYQASIHSYYNKWIKFKRQRPEAYSILVDNVKNDREKLDLPSNLLESPILEDIKAMNQEMGAENSYTLNTPFKSGSPTHPSYPSNHAVVAGACCSVLKMFYADDTPWSKIAPAVQSNDNGTQLIPYEGELTTVGDEINKLAMNIAMARSWGGVHYITDGEEGIRLGEEIAVEYMKEKLKTWRLKNKSGVGALLTFRKFDGSKVSL